MKLKIYLWKLFSQKWRLLNFLVLMIFSGLLSLSAVSGVLGQNEPIQTNLVYPSKEVAKPGDEFNVEVKIPDNTSIEKSQKVITADINLGQLSKEAKVINLDTDKDTGNYLVGNNKNDKVVGSFSVGENGRLIFLGKVNQDIPGGQVLFEIPMKNTSNKQIDFSKPENRLSMSNLNTVSQDPVTGKRTSVNLLASVNFQGNGSGGSAGNGGGNNDINGGGSTAGSGSSGGLPQYGPDSFYALICQITCFLRPIIITLAVLMIILSGFQFVTARGNEEKINQAKNIFKWTVIGVAIVIGADLIIKILAEILGGGSTSCSC